MSAPDDGFRREARTQCRALTNGLIELERGEADVDELFRVSHSLKGSCRSVGRSGAGDIAHAVETLFEAVRAGRLAPDADLVDEAIDAVATLETALDGDPDESPTAVADALTETIETHRDAAPPSNREAPSDDEPAESLEDVDDDVAAALDAASEFDDIDALLDEADEATEPTDEAVDGWGMLTDAETDPTDAETDDPTPADEPDPSAVPDDPTAYFEQAKQEGDHTADSTDDLQAEIESVSFGEFDEDDDVSIEELLAMEPDEPADEEVDAGTTTEAASGEPGPAQAAGDEPRTEDLSAGEPAAEESPTAERTPADAVNEATAFEDTEPAVERIESAVTEVDAESAEAPEPAITPVEESAADAESTAADDQPATEAPAETDEDLRTIVERLAEPVDTSGDDHATAADAGEEPADATADASPSDDAAAASDDSLEEPAPDSGPTIDPEDGLFDGVTLPGTDADEPGADVDEPDTADELDAAEPTLPDATPDEPANAADAESTAADALDDMTLPDAGTTEPTDDDLDDLSDVELPDSDAPMDVRMDETLVEFEGDVAGLLDVDPSDVSMPGTAALTIEESSLDGDRFQPLGAGATPAAVETEQEPLTVAPDNAERLLNLAEELSLVEMRLGAAVGEAPDDAVREALAQLSSLVGEYQRTVMDVRLTPLTSAVDRLPAVARDAARSGDKKVRVETEGTDVRLDRSVVDSLGDPLGHLVRNAVAHGIEPPAERAAAGKPETGTVTVSAERVRDEVVVEVSDDGAGVEIDSVRERAVEAGLVDPDTAAMLDEDAVLDLLFESGLSTADEVTEVAGRGVGMDAVASAVRRVDGDVSVETTAGEGTTVRLTLPVSVALTEVLLVHAGGQRFAVPLSAVEQVSALPDPRVEDDRETVRRADLEWGSDPAGGADVDRSYPLVRLSETFDLAGEPSQLLWLRPEAGDAALAVDEVVGTREVVVRPYGEVFGPSAAVSGAATVGDGETVNVLDPAAIAGGV